MNAMNAANDTNAPLIERYKGIAEHIRKRTGVAVSEQALRHLARRRENPLPTVRFNGRVAAREAELDAWIASCFQDSSAREAA
jgi:hypothetical protein